MPFELYDPRLMPRRDVLTVYTVYDRPRDYFPDFVVVLPSDVLSGEVVHRPISLGFVNLNAAQQWCMQLGLHRVPRHPEDHREIIEVWL